MTFSPSIAYPVSHRAADDLSNSVDKARLTPTALRFGTEEHGQDHFVSHTAAKMTDKVDLTALASSKADKLETLAGQAEIGPRVLEFNPKRPQSWVKLVSQLSRILGPSYVGTRLNGLSIEDRAKILSDKLWFSTLKAPLQDHPQQTARMLSEWQTHYGNVAEPDFLQHIAQQGVAWVQAQLKKGTSPDRLRQTLTLMIETGLAGGNAKLVRLLRQILSPQWKKTPPERQPILLAEALGPLWVRLLQSRKQVTAFMQEDLQKTLLQVPAKPEAKKVCAALWDTRPTPIPFKTVQNRIERDLKRPLRTAFSHFEEEPIAVTAMAQFHKAHLENGIQGSLADRLKDTPTEVLVKVMKPGMAGLIAEDNGLFSPLRRLLSQTYPELDQSSLLDPIFKVLHPETDMRSEAKLRALVAAALQKNSRLQVSQAILSHTGNHTLTTPWVDATALSVLPRGQQQRAAGHYLDTMLEQLFKAPLYPVDPHPSHVSLLHPNAALAGGQPPQWVLRNAVDVSLSSEKERQQLARFLAAAYTGDVDLVIQQILPPGRGLSSERYQQLLKTMRPVLQEPVQKFTTADEWQRWGANLLKASQQLGSTSLDLPSAGLITSLISTIMTAKQLDGNLNVWDAVSQRVAEVLLTSDPLLLARGAAVRLSRMLGG